MSGAVRQTTSKEILERHAQSVTGALYRYTSIAFARGEGPYFYDAEGKRYVDFASGIGTNNIGHCHPEVVAAVTDQAGKLMHAASPVGYYEEYVEYAERIKAVAPAALRAGKVLFVNTGSEAVETGIKLARMVTNRPAILAFLNSFHGRPMGALSVTASSAGFRKSLSGLFGGVYHSPYPYCYRCPLGHKSAAACDLACLEYARRLLKTIVPPGDLAGIIVEPVLGEGGYVVPPNEFLLGLRKICDETGALLILDEVQTGFGRTGKMFAAEHSGVQPDVMVMAKAMGGGLPLGGILARKDFMDQWEPGSHGTTFGGNPVSCRAGMATLEIIRRENLPGNAAELGEYLMGRLRDSRLKAIGDVRGKGLMVAAELVEPDGGPAAHLIKDLVKEIGRRGVVMTKCGESGLRFIPPLNITLEQLDEGLNIVLETIADLTK